MKKTLIALATLAAAGTAFAQSTVTLSGSIATGVEATGQVGADGDARVARFGSGFNAININSVEDLGGGMRAGYTAQIRFDPSNGNSNNSTTLDTAAAGASNLFHAANAFVSGGFGTIRVGKIAEASTCGMDPWACGGGAAMQAGTGLSALTGAQPHNNSVGYTSPTINGFSVGYQTSLSARNEERQTLNVNYANGPLTATLIDIKGSAGGAIATTATANRALGVAYNFGFANVSVVNSTADDVAGKQTANLTSIAATIPMGAYSILAGHTKDSKAATGKPSAKTAVGVNYSLSKRTIIGADLYKVDTYDSTGFVARVRHAF
jgi:predicted porin